MLDRCLRTVVSQDYEPKEVLVLDDASKDPDSYRTLVNQYNNIQLIRSNTQLGVAAGRNKLVSMASGDVLCFIDDDAYFAGQSALSTFVSALKRDPLIGIVACKIVDQQKDGVRLLVPFRRAQAKDKRLADAPCYVAYYLGGCHAIRREVFERCGLYHDTVFGEEELDLSYRAIAVGYRIYYEPRVVVHHEPMPSVVGAEAAGRGDELYYHVQNRLYLAYRYLPARYIPTYLTIWLAKYFGEALTSRKVSWFLRGLWDGLHGLRSVQRTVLHNEALLYISENHGRLWY